MAKPGRHLPRRTWPQLTAVVLGGALFNGLFAIPIRRPRVIGDELIYWELGRAFAWTGHFTVRGGEAPRYGIVYPALLAAAQRIGSDQQAAYAIAQGLNAVLFSLAALPTYAIAVRVLPRRAALVVAAAAVVLPSCIYTSTIMTENVFYPLFLTCALLMLRALEKPTAGRQLSVAGVCAVLFLTRAQAVVLLPSYLGAALLMAVVSNPGRRRSALVASLRQQAPTIAVLVLAGIAALTIRGRSTLGPYQVLVTSYNPRQLLQWALVNVADIELYVGVVPLAAFAVLLVWRPASEEVRRLVLLTACLGLGLLATVAVLGASEYGLGRAHERNLFCLVPLVLIAFLVWLRAGLPRPRFAATLFAIAVVLPPLAIPRTAVRASGEDGIAMLVWAETGLRPRQAIAGMVLVAVLGASVFLASRSWHVPVALCLVALVVGTVIGERHAIVSVRLDRSWRGYDWIDRAVGADAHVVALWATSKTGLQKTFEDVWADEFFNRSVRDVASADGLLPDGLPIATLTIGPDGCLHAPALSRARYAVVETKPRLAGQAVAASSTGLSALYRLNRDERCVARLKAVVRR